MSDITAEVARLGARFWWWRHVQAPRSPDDIPRLERPSGWLPDWSPQSVDRYREDLVELRAAWHRIDTSAEAVPVQVDYRLIGSALARVEWELERLGTWRRDPSFYVDQTVGVYFDALLRPPPFTLERQEYLVSTLEAVPAALEAAQANLTNPAAPFAEVAAERLADLGERLLASVAALEDFVETEHHKRLTASAGEAASALDGFRSWLSRPGLDPATTVGREHFVFFLSHVALWPHTPEELIAMGRQEWDRAVAFETLEANRNRDLPSLRLPASAEEQAEINQRDGDHVRRFYEEEGLLSQPSTLRNYRNLVMPPYLEPLSWLGVTDDLTSPTRLDEDGISYVPTPSPDLGYFYHAFAVDPRTGIAHEGAHYQQLALSYAHENPLRRYYYDSGPNEGIGFYNEELLLQAGLFDDSPRSREIIYSFMRLRSLRVEVDVQLALGDIDLDQAGAHLEKTVPMDRATAWEEAVFFAANPGQGLTYQIGKLAIIRLLADARQVQGDDFSLRAFHDYLWRNGNVPISLLRWELLNDRSDLDGADRLADLSLG